MPGRKKANVIYGLHPVSEAIQAGQSIDKIFVRKGSAEQERIREVRELARENNVPIQLVPDVKLKNLCGDVSHQGIAAVIAPIQFYELEAHILGLQQLEIEPLLVMLDGVTDVRNFGAIARSAECFGVHGLIVPERGSASVNADAIKTSAGALHHLPILRVKNLVDAVLMLQAYEIPVFAVSEKADETVYDTDLTGSRCLVMGAEDKGISKSLLKRVDYMIKVPLYGNTSSLNVSVAAGIVMAESARQRIELREESSQSNQI